MRISSTSLLLEFDSFAGLQTFDRIKNFLLNLHQRHLNPLMHLEIPKQSSECACCLAAPPTVLLKSGNDRVFSFSFSSSTCANLSLKEYFEINKVLITHSGENHHLRSFDAWFSQVVPPRSKPTQRRTRLASLWWLLEQELLPTTWHILTSDPQTSAQKWTAEEKPCMFTISFSSCRVSIIYTATSWFSVYHHHMNTQAWAGGEHGSYFKICSVWGEVCFVQRLALQLWIIYGRHYRVSVSIGVARNLVNIYAI